MDQNTVFISYTIMYTIGVALYIFGTLLYVSSALKVHSLINPIITIIDVFVGVFIIWSWNKVLNN